MTPPSPNCHFVSMGLAEEFNQELVRQVKTRWYADKLSRRGAYVNLADPQPKNELLQNGAH